VSLKKGRSGALFVFEFSCLMKASACSGLFPAYAATTTTINTHLRFGLGVLIRRFIIRSTYRSGANQGTSFAIGLAGSGRFNRRRVDGHSLWRFGGSNTRRGDTRDSLNRRTCCASGSSQQSDSDYQRGY
jgi:hypothetical protein